MHQAQPDIYKDENHKPELAVALTQFEALCGFRPISEIKHYLKTIPELRIAIGQNAAIHLASSEELSPQSALRNCFASLMSQEAGVIAEQLRKLLGRLSNLGINLWFYRY